jgi:GTPase SAR1 family protein
MPTVYDFYIADAEIDSKHVELLLCDTAGLEDYDRLRPFTYPFAHCILIGFSIDNPDSLDNVEEKVRPLSGIKDFHTNSSYSGYQKFYTSAPSSQLSSLG